jgi:hypothetical protein
MPESLCECLPVREALKLFTVFASSCFCLFKASFELGGGIKTPFLLKDEYSGS